MTHKGYHKIISVLIASTWIVNGLFCKLLNYVPRHQQIVARIMGDSYSELLTKAIGISETLMGLWIISGFMSRFNALIQMSLILLMNILEFILAPDLLYWGRLNIVFAFLLIIIIGYNEFVLNKKPVQPA